MFSWPLSEVKALTGRERSYWFRVAQDVRSRGKANSVGEVSLG